LIIIAFYYAIWAAKVGDIECEIEVFSRAMDKNEGVFDIAE
jgi:hypothetical protein